MKFLVVIPTKSKNDPLLVEGCDYLKRLRPPFSASFSFLQPKAPESKRLESEANELLRATEGSFRIALTEYGKQYSSVEFAVMIEQLMPKTSKISFVIGGAFGLSKDVIATCNKTLSLSPLTMPHRMAFLVLAEQIYRATEIIGKTPYHK